MVVPPECGPLDPAPRRTTPLFKLTVVEMVYVPAASKTTWPSGHAFMAALRSVPGLGLAQTVVRTGSPSLPRGK